MSQQKPSNPQNEIRMRGTLKVEFLASKKFIEEQKEAGWPVKAMWAYLKKEGRFLGSYRQFVYWFNNFFSEAEVVEKTSPVRPIQDATRPAEPAEPSQPETSGESKSMFASNRVLNLGAKAALKNKNKLI